MGGPKDDFLQQERAARPRVGFHHQSVRHHHLLHDHNLFRLGRGPLRSLPILPPLLRPRSHQALPARLSPQSRHLCWALELWIPRPRLLLARARGHHQPQRLRPVLGRGVHTDEHRQGDGEEAHGQSSRVHEDDRGERRRRLYGQARGDYQDDCRSRGAGGQDGGRGAGQGAGDAGRRRRRRRRSSTRRARTRRRIREQRQQHARRNRRASWRRILCGPRRSRRSGGKSARRAPRSRAASRAAHSARRTTPRPDPAAPQSRNPRPCHGRRRKVRPQTLRRLCPVLRRRPRDGLRRVLRNAQQVRSEDARGRPPPAFRLVRQRRRRRHRLQRV
mmetsp:Transcript_5084/g.17687  ORF Transcript_5084/g.17687 Transcript_5084/m.17687 type:complete len:332 (+) Transcript_5084:1660-2655(+)